MKLPLLVFSAISLFAFTAKAEPLTVGAAAPVVTAKDQDGEPVNFADVYSKGKRWSTSTRKPALRGARRRPCSLRDSFADLSQEGLQVIGVSEDTVDSQKKFKDEQKLPFTLVADSDGKVADAFGVPVTMGRAKRQSFIVKEGKIAWVSPQAKTTEHAQEVQAALGSLN